MLMKKLPDESLKRKCVDRAGDLIKSKGRAEYSDFVSLLEKRRSVSTIDMDKN